MNGLLWAVVAVIGIGLTVMASRIGSEVFVLRGRPYGFATERRFQVVYRAMGTIFIASSVAALAFHSDLDILGLVIMAGGGELCLRSREIGTAFWRKASRHPEERTYHQGVLLSGSFAIVLGLIALLRL